MRERYRKLQKQYELLLEKHKATVKAFHGNPDMEEGPHMGLPNKCSVFFLCNLTYVSTLFPDGEKKKESPKKSFTTPSRRG
jgi:hypothetical protein